MDGENTIPDENRNELIGKAVDFLVHPKLVDAPLSEKRAFLLQKGLSELEIDDAMKKSGITKSILPYSSGGIAQQAEVVPPTGQKIKNVAIFSIVFGGISYGIYLFIKKIVQVYLINKDKKIEDISKNIDNLKETVTLILKNQSHLQETIDINSEKMKNSSEMPIPNQYTDLNTTTNSFAIKELKNEIISLKGLLLNKDQFPKVPVHQPVIPSWQLSHTIEDKSSTIELDKDDAIDKNGFNSVDELASFTDSVREDDESHSNIVTNQLTADNEISMEDTNTSIVIVEKNVVPDIVEDHDEKCLVSPNEMIQSNVDKLELDTSTNECADSDKPNENIDITSVIQNENDEYHFDIVTKHITAVSEISIEDIGTSMLIVEKNDVPDIVDDMAEKVQSPNEMIQSAILSAEECTNSYDPTENINTLLTEKELSEQVNSTYETGSEDSSTSILVVENSDCESSH